jgi:hypothetical protein
MSVAKAGASGRHSNNPAKCMPLMMRSRWLTEGSCQTAPISAIQIEGEPGLPYGSRFPPTCRQGPGLSGGRKKEREGVRLPSAIPKPPDSEDQNL